MNSPPLAQLLSQASDVLMAVRAGQSLTAVLARFPANLRAGTQALAFHGLRCLAGALALRKLLAPKSPPPEVDALLLLALALLWPAEQPPPYAEHTLVDQAVTAARQRTPAAAKFINAVLRRFLREREALLTSARQQPEALWQHPAWWIGQVQRDWPESWQAILTQANQRPPMVLRVNLRRGTVQGYLQRLHDAGHAASQVGPEQGQAVVLTQPCPVQALPGFDDGDVSVQDLSAQRAAGLLLGEGAGVGKSRLPRGARVLDACAAPGGKTAHLLELAELDLLALDADAQRLAQVRSGLDRLHLDAELRAADARDTTAWWDGRPFDAVLLDAPCTASGITRRHPDVRWLRRPTDIATLAQTQAELLEALWPLLKPGGRLLYATCSVFKSEGQHQTDAFLQRHAADGARLDPASPGHLLGVPDNPPAVSPAETGSHAQDAVGDGFFYALIEKPCDKSRQKPSHKPPP